MKFTKNMLSLFLMNAIAASSVICIRRLSKTLRSITCLVSLAHRFLQKNTGAVTDPHYFTTAQTFGDQLHTYTIVDAINDKNRLAVPCRLY